MWLFRRQIRRYLLLLERGVTCSRELIPPIPKSFPKYPFQPQTVCLLRRVLEGTFPPSCCISWKILGLVIVQYSQKIARMVSYSWFKMRREEKTRDNPAWSRRGLSVPVPIGSMSKFKPTVHINPPGRIREVTTLSEFSTGNTAQHTAVLLPGTATAGLCPGQGCICWLDIHYVWKRTASKSPFTERPGKSQTGASRFHLYMQVKSSSCGGKGQEGWGTQCHLGWWTVLLP